MRLAFYTYSYTDRLKLPVPECLARIAKSGYAGIDESSTFGAAVNSDSVAPARRKLIRETARQHKLRVEAIVTHAELTTTLGTKEPLDLKAAVDLKDHIGKYPKWEHRIPGQGEFDYVPIIQALANAKFGGALAVECFTDMKFEEACDAGYTAMARAFDKAGESLSRD